MNHMSIQDIIWNYLRNIFNIWLSTNWNLLEKSLRNDLINFREKIYNCNNMEKVKELILAVLPRLYLSSPNEAKEAFKKLLKDTEEYFKNNGMDINFNKFIIPHKISLIIKDDYGKPIKLAQIVITFNGKEVWRGETSNDGKVNISLGEGKYTIFASFNEEEYYGLNIVELKIPTGNKEEIIIIRRYPKYESAKVITNRGRKTTFE